jgi:hypothetical protein
MAITQVPNSLLTQPVNHNILINPSFTVFQRAGTTDSGAWGVDHNKESYGPDRWKVYGATSGVSTVAQSSTDSSTGVNKLVVKHPNATSMAYAFQRIEAVNVLGLYGKEMTFSFSYSDVGGSGIPKVIVYSYDSSVNFKVLLEAVPTSLGDNRWTCTFTLSTPDGTVPDPSERGMQVVIFPNEDNTAPNEWSLWDTKLEVGSVATPFIARSYGEELALCQRYYQQLAGAMFGTMTNGQGGFTDLWFTGLLPVEMRTSPSVFVLPKTIYLRVWGGTLGDTTQGDRNFHGSTITKIDGAIYTKNSICGRFTLPSVITRGELLLDRTNNGTFSVDAEL